MVSRAFLFKINSKGSKVLITTLDANEFKTELVWKRYFKNSQCWNSLCPFWIKRKNQICLMAKTVKWPSSHVPITWVASIKTLCSRCGHSVAHEQSIWFGHFFRPWCHHTDLEVSFRPCIPLHHLVALLELLEPWAYHLPWDIPVKTALQPKSKMDRLLQFVGFSVWALFKKHRHIMQSIKPMLFSPCCSTVFILSWKCMQIWNWNSSGPWDL